MKIAKQKQLQAATIDKTSEWKASQWLIISKCISQVLPFFLVAQSRRCCFTLSTTKDMVVKKKTLRYSIILPEYPSSLDAPVLDAHMTTVNP